MFFGFKAIEVSCKFPRQYLLDFSLRKLLVVKTDSAAEALYYETLCTDVFRKMVCRVVYLE